MTLPPRNERHAWLRGQAPEKVTTIDLFYLRSMMRGQWQQVGVAGGATEIDHEAPQDAPMYSSWMVDRMTEHIDEREMRYHRFDDRIVLDTHLEIERRRVSKFSEHLWYGYFKNFHFHLCVSIPEMLEVFHELTDEKMIEWLTRGHVSVYEMN
nr:hypothetical protein [Tanacetum cinerariifolium]